LSKHNFSNPLLGTLKCVISKLNQCKL